MVSTLLSLVITIHFTQAPGAPADSAYTRSLALMESFLDRYPTHAELRFVLGDVHFRQGRYREALEAFGLAARLDPRDPKPILWAAEAETRLGQHELAAATFRRLLVKEWAAVEPAARLGLAENLYQLSRFVESAAEARAALRLGEPSPRARYLLARALEGQVKAGLDEGAGKEAIARLEKEEEAALADALRLDPNLAAAHYLLGTLHRRQGNLERARAELEAFRKLKPLSSEANLDRLERDGRDFEARTILDLTRALVSARAGAEAAGLLERALRETPRADLESQLGWVHLQLGRLDDAARAYDRALQLDPRHADALFQRGVLWFRQGQKQRAAELFLQALEARQGYAEALEVLTELAQDHGVLQERREELARRSVAARPSAVNYSRWAMALIEAGKRVECERVLREGLARHPGNPELTTGLQALGGAGR